MLSLLEKNFFNLVVIFIQIVFVLQLYFFTVQIIVYIVVLLKW